MPGYSSKCYSEHKNRHMLAITRILVHESHVPLSFWPASMYLFNSISHYQTLFQHPADYFFLHVFACKCLFS